MSKNGPLTEENVLIPPVKEKKKSRSSHINKVKENVFQHDPIVCDSTLIKELKDFDSDSGVSSIRQSRGKLATSASKTNVAWDDDLDDEGLGKGTSENLTLDDVDRRSSDATSITGFTINKTSSEFFLTSRTNSLSSAGHHSSTPLPMMISPAQQRMGATAKPPISNPVEQKSKGGMRKFIRKIFGSGSTSTRSSSTARGASLDTQPKHPELNIDHVRGTAYPRSSPLPITQGPIRLLLLRHGERLDRFYSSQWLRQAFDKDGNYCRFSPILPETLPFRASIRDFDLDPPLTYKGLKDSYHTGTVLRDKNIQINYCYSSPSLRCVQTASKILEGLQLQNKVKIRLEPGLFECTGWYTVSETNQTLTMPRFLTKKEFLENKYPVEKHYQEKMTYADICQVETELQFYERSHAVTSNILKSHEAELISQIQQGYATTQQNLHVLLIAHAPNLETCTRKLCGGKFRPDTLAHVIRNVDFLTMTVIEKTDNTCDKWIFRRSSFYGDEF